jgi:hypothetical protein
MRFITYLTTLLLAAFLTACGGGGGAPGLPSGVGTPLTTSAPATLTVAVGATQSFVMTGGTAPYQISSSNVQVAVASLTGRDFTLTGVASGNVTITISDAMQKTSTISVTVGNLAQFSTSAPLALNVAPKSTTQPFSLSGGVQGARYEWSSSDARIATAQIDGNVLRISGLAVGQATISLRDSAPTPAVIDINVTVGGGTTEPFFTTAPGSLTVAPLSLTTFPIGGGVPPYRVPSSSDSRVATASINASATTLSISAGTTAGTTTIDVFDSVGNGLRITVTVAGGTAEPLNTTVPTTEVTIGIGLTRQFSIGGGVAEYTVVSSDDGIATVSKDGNNNIFIRGIAAGTVTIVVRDRVGTTLTRSIKVGTSSAIFHTAPATLAMTAGASRSFTISGGTPAYVATSSNEDSVIATANGSTLTITARAAGSATIKLIDASGTEGASITVTVTGGSVGTPSAASVEVISSLSSLLSSGPGAVITAFVKDAGNVGMADQVVTFSANSGTLQSASTLTDAAGVATATLIAGSNKSNRDIVVQVAAGAARGTVTVPVTGTSVSIAGVSSLQISTVAKPVTASYTLRALDSSSNPISGATLTLTSSLGNTLSASSVVTDATGSATVVYTPVNAGSDVLKVTGQGATAQTTVEVSAVDFSVISPAPNSTIAIGTQQLITVQYQLSGVGQAGKTVTFSTTRGTIVPVVPNTLPAGQYSAMLSSTTAGQATVTAQIAGVGSVTLPVEFVATVPATVILQSNPGAIAPNTTGTTNQSTISAVVRDATGNPVKNRQVNFTLTQDLSNGTLSSGSAITNSNGQASVQFIAGPTSTPNNGVVVTAVEALTGLTGTTSLTVSAQALFITIGFGNEIGNVDQTTYSRVFSVYVTDANGVAVGNQSVALSVIPTLYEKGRLQLPIDSLVWTLPATRTVCQNEDALLGSGAAGYLNGILNTGEDINGNGRLEPGNVAVAAPGIVVTDANGRATFAVQYGEQFAPWVTVNVEARAVVAGTESRKAVNYVLVGSAPDFTTPNTPAGVNSPFGAGTVCTNPN